MDVVLPQWIAVELVCKVICRFEKRKFIAEEYRDLEKLQDFLNQYIAKEVSEKIALQVFGNAIHVNKHYSKIPHSRSFHTLISNVRKEREVKLRKEVFKKYKDYIKEPTFGSKLVIEKSSLTLSRKRNELAGNGYQFFYYFKDPDYHIEGVVNGFLKFDFSKVTLTTYEPHTRYFFEYVGSYDVHKIEGGYVLQLTFLTQKLKTSEKEKQINFTISVGEGDIEEAFGAMYQVNPRFECANIILTKPDYDDFRKNVSIRFNSISEDGNSGYIWPLMWDFFILYKTRFVQEMPIFGVYDNLAEFLNDYIKEYKEKLYQQHEVNDVNRELDHFENELLQYISYIEDTTAKKKLVNHFAALKEAYLLSNLERVTNPIVKETGSTSSWFKIYYLSILEQMK